MPVCKKPTQTRRPRRAIIEPMEPRILLSADLSFAMGEGANDLTLLIDQVDDGSGNLVDTIQLMNNESSLLEKSQALSETSGVTITGTDSDDRLSIGFSFQGMADAFPILFSDNSTIDSDTLDFSLSEDDLTVAVRGQGSLTVTDGQYTVSEDGTVSLAGWAPSVTRCSYPRRSVIS